MPTDWRSPSCPNQRPPRLQRKRLDECALCLFTNGLPILLRSRIDIGTHGAVLAHTRASLGVNKLSTAIFLTRICLSSRREHAIEPPPRPAVPVRMPQAIAALYDAILDLPRLRDLCPARQRSRELICQFAYVDASAPRPSTPRDSCLVNFPPVSSSYLPRSLILSPRTTNLSACS